MRSADTGITREEYLRLLDMARESNDERAYLPEKLFVSCRRGGVHHGAV